jgi:hypothetical protein
MVVTVRGHRPPISYVVDEQDNYMDVVHHSGDGCGSEVMTIWRAVKLRYSLTD